MSRTFACALRRLGSSVAAGAALALALGAGAPEAVAQPRPMKIGLFFDVTGGGASAAEAAQFGAELAIRDINAAGGIAGRKLEVVTADTQTDATVGVGEIKRLALQEKVDIVLGPLISQVLIAAAPVLNEAKIASIGSTGSEQITPQLAPYYFSALVNAEAQAKAMTTQAADVLKAKSAAILSDSGAQAKSFVESIKKEMAARNLKVTGVQEYQYRATDMTPQLLALKRGNPDTLLLFTSSGEDAGNAVKSLAELGWKVRVTGNYSVATFAPTAVKIAGKEAFKDVTGTNYRAFTFCPGGERPKAFLDFVAKARAYKPEVAARLSMAFASLLYESAYLMKAAVEASGGKTDGPTVAAWIEENARNYKGMLGKLSASKTSHFLIGVEALATVYPDRLEDGVIQQRYGC
jgi:ABC-type branched-subunit amino acid transport system substrate-binding protein